MKILVALVILIAAMIIGIPVPLAFLLSATQLCVVNGTNTQMLLSYGYKSVNSVLLLTIPLFVLAGSLINNGGLGEKLCGAVERTRLGKVKGGLGIVSVVACAVFGAVSGSSSATLSCVGSIMTPKMKEAGYSDGLVGSLLASSGVLGILIPPSMIMILYAWASNASVLGCFLATILPGILLVILLSLVNCYLYKRNQKDGTMTLTDAILESAKLKERAKQQNKEKETSAVPALIMPLIILGSIYGGFLTATEAAALSVFYAIPVGIFYYKRINWSTYKKAMIDAGKTAGVIMTMLFCVQILSRLYITENLPNTILSVLTAISSNKVVILLMLNLFMVVMGMLMDDTSCTILLTPILLPVATSLGLSPFHFAAILGVNIGMGNITPPTAPLLYLSGRITGAQVKDMLKPTLLMICFAWLPTLILTTYCPIFSEILPRLLGSL